MMRTLGTIARTGLLAATLASATASACGSEPAVSDNASFQRWRTWCSCKGGSPPATFNEAQRVGCRAASSSATPGLTAPQTGGQALGQALGLLVLEAFKEDPNAEARRREAAARAESERIAREEAERARADRLLGEMLEVGNGAPSTPGQHPAPGGLGLMLGDEVPRVAGPALVVGGLPLMTGDEVSTSVTAGTPDPGSGGDKVKRSDAFDLGFNDARNCFSQSAGARCSTATAAAIDACLADYRGGYSAGEKAKALKMDEAHRIGRADASAGKPANAVGRPEAEGTCKVEWTENYNRGWFQAKPRP